VNAITILSVKQRVGESLPWIRRIGRDLPGLGLSMARCQEGDTERREGERGLAFNRKRE
jgi:hypothetical protein